MRSAAGGVLEVEVGYRGGVTQVAALHPPPERPDAAAIDFGLSDATQEVVGAQGVTDGFADHRLDGFGRQANPDRLKGVL